MVCQLHCTWVAYRDAVYVCSWNIHVMSRFMSTVGLIPLLGYIHTILWPTYSLITPTGKYKQGCEYITKKQKEKGKN